MYLNVFLWFHQVCWSFPSKNLKTFYVSSYIALSIVFILAWFWKHLNRLFHRIHHKTRLSSNFPLNISMCYFILSSEILLLNNETCQRNALLLPNTESTLFFSLFILFLVDSALVFVGLIALLVFDKKNNQVSFIMIFILFLSYVTHFSVFIISIDKKNLICWICSTIFIKTLFSFLFICFLVDSSVNFLYLWRVYWLFT